jgi:hypothetical protein
MQTVRSASASSSRRGALSALRRAHLHDRGRDRWGLRLLRSDLPSSFSAALL